MSRFDSLIKELKENGSVDMSRAANKRQRAHGVGFGVMGVALPGPRSVPVSMVDRQPPKHKRGFSERYLACPIQTKG